MGAQDRAIAKNSRSRPSRPPTTLEPRWFSIAAAKGQLAWLLETRERLRARPAIDRAIFAELPSQHSRALLSRIHTFRPLRYLRTLFTLVSIAPYLLGSAGTPDTALVHPNLRPYRIARSRCGFSSPF